MNKIPSLQELCYDSLANTMNTAPPLLQEMIMGETRERIKKEVEKELVEKLQKNICNIFSYLVPEIIEDITASMNEIGRARRDFRAEYKHIDTEVIECAISTAEIAVSSMDNHYVNRPFVMNAMSAHGAWNEGEFDGEYSDDSDINDSNDSNDEYYL